MKKLILFAVVAMLFATHANAGIWNITSTVQNGDETATGFGSDRDGYGNEGVTSATLGFVGWFTIGTNGGGSQMLNGRGIAPINDYNCYGLTLSSDTCSGTGAPTFWSTTNAEWSGFVNDDPACVNAGGINPTPGQAPAAGCMSLSWTGIVGSEVAFGTNESLFISGVNSGAYDGAGDISGGVDLGDGYDADGFVCWNNPNNGLPGQPDFCGNQTGVPWTASSSTQSKFNRELPLGITLFTDNGDGTITIDMGDNTYATCVADAGCEPDTNSSDVFAQWRVNAVIPIPAAVWLFGSALGLLGWLRRRASA